MAQSKKSAQSTDATRELATINGHEAAAAIGLELLRQREQSARHAQSFMASMNPHSLRAILTWLDATAFHAAANRRQLEGCTLAHHLMDTLIPAWEDALASGDQNAVDYRKLDIQNALQALGQRGSSAVKDQPHVAAAVRGYLTTFGSLRRVHYAAVAQRDKLSAILERELKIEQRARGEVAALETTLSDTTAIPLSVAQATFTGAAN